MKNLFILLIVITAGWKLFNYSGQVMLGPGVLAKELPLQVAIGSSAIREIGEYSITELARFSIKAKVLSKTDYYFDRGADLSPTDLALGWGRMSDEGVLETIDISQSGRFYRWYVDAFPIPRGEIQTHSANMHLIPANDSVADDIASVRAGEIVEISGSLVEVKSNDDGWRWRSSLTRKDTGDGACELIFVESLRIVSP